MKKIINRVNLTVVYTCINIYVLKYFGEILRKLNLLLSSSNYEKKIQNVCQSLHKTYAPKQLYL